MQWVAVWIVKHLVDRSRPSDPLVHSTGASFPSAHAANSIGWLALALVLGVLAPHRVANPHRRDPHAGGMLALLIALSRVYLRAHYFSDIIGGASLSVSMYALAVILAGPETVARSRRSSVGTEESSRDRLGRVHVCDDDNRSDPRRWRARPSMPPIIPSPDMSCCTRGARSLPVLRSGGRRARIRSTPRTSSERAPRDRSRASRRGANRLDRAAGVSRRSRVGFAFPARLVVEGMPAPRRRGRVVADPRASRCRVPRRARELPSQPALDPILELVDTVKLNLARSVVRA